MKNAHLQPDSSLWSLIKADSIPAFNEVYARYWEVLFRVAYKRLPSKEIAEEIVQDTFIILWEKRHTIEITTLKSYLFAITRYAIFHYHARQETIRARMLEMAAMTASAPDIEAVVNARLLLQLVDAIAAELPEKSRLVFAANKLQDHALAASAESFNISVKTAEGHLTRALKTVRLKLGTLYSTLFL